MEKKDGKNSQIDYPSTWEYVKYFSRKIMQVLGVLYSQYFEVLYHWRYFRARSISRFCTTADTSGLAVFRGSLLWILPVLGYCINRGFWLLVEGVASTGSLSSVGNARTASTRSYCTKILSICLVYSEYARTMCVCTVSIISCPLFYRKHPQMVPQAGVGACCFRWEQLECLEYST